MSDEPINGRPEAERPPRVDRSEANPPRPDPVEAAAAEAAAEHERTDEAEQLVEHDLDELATARRERDEYLELARRTKADFENYRKRVSREAADAAERGKAGLARELIPVLDNLERALQAAGFGDAGPAGDAPSEVVPPQEALGRGIALVEAELRATLERAGVESYDPAGERFDPAWHEALSTLPRDDVKSGTVIETLERGYRLDGQVLRPARVVVSE
ncbi:MAG: nucleotide exchange factor GrpE [Solirubrobacterales bacterium]